MSGTSSTPIWLDMRTEYIDANFDKFIEYLYNNRAKTADVFYKTSMDLFRKRVEEIIAQIASEPLSQQDFLLEDNDNDITELWIRLLGAYILSENDKKKSVRAYVYQILLLIRVCPPERTEVLSELALSLLVNDERFNPGYSWSDILQFYPDVLASKIVTYAKCGQSNTGVRWFEGNGCARLKDGLLQILNLKEKESAEKQVKSLSLVGDRISIMSAVGDKLKQSLQNDITALSQFTKDYIQNMTPVNLRLGEKKLKKYYPDRDKSIDVKITEVSYDSISAVTIDKDYYPVHGKIFLRNTLCFSLLDLIKHWNVGDELPCRITDISANGIAIFDVTDEIINFVVNEHVKSGETTTGIATKITNGNTMWLSDLGVPLYTQHEEYEPGVIGNLRVTEVCSNGYIKCVLDSEIDSKFFDPNPSKKNFLRYYCYEQVSDIGTPEASEVERIEYSDLRAVMTCLYLKQRLEPEPIERFRLLCAIQIMCRLVDDAVSSDFVHFMTQYLGNVMFFAKGQYEAMSIPTVSEQIKEDAAVVRRLKILEVLCCYGHDDADNILEEAVEHPDETINHLAKVIQSCNRLHGVLSEPMRNAIMHEILKMLRVEDYAATDLEEEGGVYLGIENGHQEFKTSFIYPPDNQMQPQPSVQKMNVFKAVCAFLNSESGGVVYLGVNDLGTVTGVENDLNYLKKTLDGYMRYITDEAKKEFGLGILTFLDILPMYDERVVAINVKPCDYKVVELAGKAYIRTNAESREMTKSVRLRIEERRRTYDKHYAESVSSIQSAIANRRQVVVHGYSSSHGGDRRDRNLEPFAFTTEKKHIWCYDLDDRKVKLFSVARISNVEILDKEWTATQYHKEGNLDIFYMTGETPIRISLELDRMAYNLMIEEYPESKHCLEDTLHDSWILNTDVYNILGVGRFYIGLADHITILNALELKEYAREYFEKQSKVH